MTLAQTPIQPVPTVTHHPPGETAANPRVGDFLLTGLKVQGLVSWAIKTGSYLRGYEKRFRRFSHSALVIAEDGTLAEAQARGVVKSPLSHYDAADYVLVRTHVDDHDAKQVLAFAQSVLDARWVVALSTNGRTLRGQLSREPEIGEPPSSRHPRRRVPWPRARPLSQDPVHHRFCEEAQTRPRLVLAVTASAC